MQVNRALRRPGFRGQAPRVFTPKDYGSSLALWLRADLGVVESSGVVSWTDQSSGGARYSWNTSKPTRTTNSALGGAQVIRFGSASAKLVCDITGTAIGANWSIVFVGAMPNTLATSVMLQNATGGQGFAAYAAGDSTNTKCYAYATDGTSVLTGGWTSAPGASLAGVWVLSSDTTRRSMGQASSATWTGGGRGINWTTSGAMVTASATAANDAAEIIVVNRAGGLPELGLYLQRRCRGVR